MKTLEVAFAGMAMLALVGVSVANAGKEHYGRADDVGSAEFAMIAQCMAPEDQLRACMEDNGFVFLPNARVWGNEGPRCKNDKENGVFHSWCWKKGTQE